MTSFTRIRLLSLVTISLGGGYPLGVHSCWAADLPPPLRISRTVLAEGDHEWDWMHARTAFIPRQPPLAITTMSQSDRSVTHGYHDVYLSTSTDRGATWSTPRVVPSLRRFRRSDGFEVAAGDLWPVHHARTDTVLITGKTFNFAEGSREDFLREQVAYAVLDPTTGACGPLRTVAMPERDHAGHPILAPNAGNNQRVDLPDGDILLPIRYQREAAKRIYTTIVARCSFDGDILSYVRHGSEHSIDTGRGLYEPSVVEFRGKYYLTMRADDDAYVATSADGIDYSRQVPWTFDDGQPLGSYNTQQHWVRLGGRLYLVYTRRGADNDHIMRHRAPLFIAMVDPDRLYVIRATEQIVVPENHATLGNSGVCAVGVNEAWITVAEGHLNHGRRKQDRNRVILARITPWTEGLQP